MASAHGFIGLAKYFVGRPAETENHVQDALRLSPRDIQVNVWLLIAGIAKLALDENEAAIAYLHRAIEANRNGAMIYFTLTIALARLDRLDEARIAAQTGFRLQHPRTSNGGIQFEKSRGQKIRLSPKRAFENRCNLFLAPRPLKTGWPKECEIALNRDPTRDSADVIDKRE
jgi:tetratricopeptide (TPR) repeat protein